MDCQWEFKSWGLTGKMRRRFSLPNCWRKKSVGSSRRRDMTHSATRAATESRGAQRQEILRAFHRRAQTAEQLLKILIAFHEIDFSSIHHQQIRSRIAEEKVLVGLRDGF